MKCIVKYLLLALAAVIPLGVCAQKYPERSQVRKGNRLYERLRYDDAIKRYSHAMELSDSCYEAKFNLGDALYKAKEYDKAGEVFGALAADSLHSEKDRAQAFYNLGNTLFQQKKYQEALNAFKQSLRLNPDDREAKYNYAYTKKFVEDNNNGGGGGGGDQNQNNQNNQNDPNNQNGGQNQQNGDDKQDQNNKGDNQNDQNDKNNQGDEPDKDKNSDNKNDDGKGDDQNDDGKGDNQDGDGDRDRQPQNGDSQPEPSGISEQDAERMLDAIQGEEDKTRDKMNEKIGGGVVKSRKNW